MLYSIVGIIVIIIDQATKFWVSNTLFGTDVVKFIPGVISLVNVHNDGAAFSFLSGSGARIYFIIATGVFVILVIIALATNFISGRLARWSLVLVAAGGLGNMIDRIIYGYVQDMFKVELFNFAIFNVADVFITVFAILFALSMIFGKPDDDGDFEDEDEYEELPKKEKAPKPRRRKKDKEAEPEAAAAEEPAGKPSSARSARRARQDKYEKEYEEYKEQQRAAMRKKSGAAAPAAKAEEDALPVAAPAPAKTAEPVQEDDPFAAWERANARAEAGKADSYAGRAMDRPAADKPKAAAPAEKPKAAAPAEKPKPAAQAPKAAAQPKPAEKPAASEEFSLDDILAEFK